MATKLLVKNIQKNPSAVGTYRTMTLTQTVGSAATLQLSTDIEADGDRRVATGGTLAVTFYSERVPNEVAISGTVTWNVWATCPATWTAKLRAKLWKVTAAGGTNEETFICQSDSAQMSGTSSTKYNWTATPATGVTLGPNERFIWRLYMTPIAGSFGTGSPTVRYNEETDADGNTFISLTETIAMRDDTNKLILRRTAANGIGNFYDLLEAQGSSALTSGVVNTAASGTEIQWTRTAGGTVLEWISPRVKQPSCEIAAGSRFSGGVICAAESNLLANCGIRVKFLKRDPLGAETLIYTASTAELTTTSTGMGIAPGGTFAGTTTLHEDDRFVMRVYIINVGTMASGYTCTIAYDHNVALANGDSYLFLLEGPSFKAESDPGRVPESTMMMGGIGN